MSTVDKYAQFISEQNKDNPFRSVPLKEDTAGKTGKSQTYAMDYDTGKGASHVDKAAEHAKSSNYKVNHEFGGKSYGDADASKPAHKNPDVTMHYAHGDDEPNGYTVHHDGAAANDAKLHKKAIHMGDAD